MKNSRLWALVFSIAAALALPAVLPLGSFFTVVSSSIFCLLFAGCAYFLIECALRRMTIRLLLFSAVTGFALSLFLTVGSAVYTEYHVELSLLGICKLLLSTLLFTPFLSCGVALLFDGLPRLQALLRPTKLEQSRWNPANGRALPSFFIIWAVLLLCFLPAYLGYFPGIWGYDMHNQTHQALTHAYNSFQPLLHTLLFEGCFRLGRAIFHTANGGVALFTFVQMLLLSGCLSGVCVYLAKRLKAPFLLCILAVAFYGLLPFHGILSVSSTKDVVYGGLFLILLLQVYDLAIDPDGFFHAPLRILGFVLTVLLVCLLRNNMIYALAFLLPFLVLGLKRKRVLAAILLIVSMAVSFAGKNLLSSALQAGDGPRVEMLSIPIQQVARTYSLHRDELTEEQKAAVTEYLPEEALDAYFPLLSDPVKDHCHIGNGAPSIRGFLSVWSGLLTQYPNDYVDAFLIMTLGYWYPDENFHDWIYSGYDEEDTEESLGYLYTGFMESILPEVQKHSLWSAAENYYQWFAHENGHEGIPLLSMLFSPGFYCWALLLAMIALLYYRKLPLFLPLMLPLGVWCTLLLGPCTIVRYAYPIMAAFPLLLGVLCNGLPALRLEPVPDDPVTTGKDSRGAEVFRFAVAGGAGFVIDYACLILCKETFGMHYLAATAVGFLVSVIANYLLCAYWVFKGAGKQGGGTRAAFMLTSAIGLGLNELFMFLLVDKLSMHYLLAKLIATILVLIWNYFSKRKVLVRKTNHTEETHG